MLTVIVMTERFSARVIENYVLKGYVLHGSQFVSKDNSRTVLRIIDCDIAEHNIFILILRSFACGKWEVRPAQRTWMSSAYVSAISLLSRSDPNCVVGGVVDNDVLVGDVSNFRSLVFTTISPKFHVNSLIGVVHIGLSESYISHLCSIINGANSQTNTTCPYTLNENVRTFSFDAEAVVLVPNITIVDPYVFAIDIEAISIEGCQVNKSMFILVIASDVDMAIPNLKIVSLHSVERIIRRIMEVNVLNKSVIEMLNAEQFGSILYPL